MSRPSVVWDPVPGEPTPRAGVLPLSPSSGDVPHVRYRLGWEDGPVQTYPARAVIDLDAITANVRTLDAGTPAEVMVVVKADAYGHGLVPSARAARRGGATWLGAAQITEALALRAAGDTGRILAWLYTPGAPLREAIEADVDVAIAAPWNVAALARAAREAGRTARVQIKVDTGLGRNGVTPAQLAEVLDAAMRAQAEGVLAVVGLFSHFAFADAPAHPTVVAQADEFARAIEVVERAGARLELRHIANSAATLTNPAVHYDLVRPGLAAYGLSPVPDISSSEDLGLVPAMTFESELASVKPLPAGHGVSYAHEYVTARDTVVGLVPIGYGDGVPRHCSGTAGRPGAPVRIGSRGLAIAGRVCMDQFVVDLGPGALEVEGDHVELFGTGADGGPTAQDWAAAAGTISYEIVTRIGARVPRTYPGTPPPPRSAVRTEIGSPDCRNQSGVPISAGVGVGGGSEGGGGVSGAGGVEVALLDAAASRSYGEALAGVLRAGDLVLLTGPLGAGKTTLTQGIGAGLGVRGQVTSPTFIIARVHPSLGDGPALVHVDAYRLTSLDDLEALDLDASLEDSVTVVEWGEGLTEVLAEDRLEVTIERPRAGEFAPEEADSGERHVTVRAVGPRWAGVKLPERSPDRSARP